MIRLRPQCIVVPHSSLQKYYPEGVKGFLERQSSCEEIFQPLHGWDFDENLIVLQKAAEQTPDWETFDICIENGMQLTDENGNWLEAYISFRSKYTAEYALKTDNEVSFPYPGKDCTWLKIEQSFAKLTKNKFFEQQPPSSTRACIYIFGQSKELAVNGYSHDLPDTSKNSQLLKKYLETLNNEKEKS